MLCPPAWPALAFFAALLLPRGALHGITQEFAAVRLR
jgi:hypothetical protein